MARPLPEKFRKGSTIQPGHELNLLYAGWHLVEARVDEVYGTQIRLTLAGRDEPCYVTPSGQYLTRYLPDTNPA